MVDYGEIHEQNPDWAEAIPAVSPSYGSSFARQVASPDRPLASSLSFDDLNFLKKSSRLYRFRKVLYSAGLAAAGASNLVTDKNHDAEVTGDSGGYQAGKGTLKRSIADWLENLLPFAEKNFDLCPIADLPTGAIGKKKFRKHVDRLRSNGGFDPKIVEGVPAETLFSLCAANGLGPDFNACLWYSKFNTAWLMARANPSLRWLYVIQGRSLAESRVWLEHMREHNFAGICFPAKHLVRLEQTLYAVDELWNSGELEKYQRIHFLGTGMPQNFVVYSAILKQIRKHVNPDITCTADVSSAVQESARGILTVGVTLGDGGWSLQRIHASTPKEDLEAEQKPKKGQEQLRSELADMPPDMNLEDALFRLWLQKYFKVGAEKPPLIETPTYRRFEGDGRFFIRTEIAKHLTVGDIYDPGRGDYGTDDLAYLYMYNHNLQVYTEATVQALTIADDNTAGLMMPALQRVNDAIRRVFECPADQRRQLIFDLRRDLNIPEWLDSAPGRNDALK